MPACPSTRARLVLRKTGLAERLVLCYRTSLARSCLLQERRRALGARAQTGYQQPALLLLVLHPF